LAFLDQPKNAGQNEDFPWFVYLKDNKNALYWRQILFLVYNCRKISLTKFLTNATCSRHDIAVICSFKQ
jgi:hypothetical protein